MLPKIKEYCPTANIIINTHDYISIKSRLPSKTYLTRIKSFDILISVAFQPTTNISIRPTNHVMQANAHRGARNGYFVCLRST